MAYTIMLVDGPNSLTQNTVYALPGKSKYCKSDAALEVSTTVGGTFAAVVATTTGVLLPGSCFARCTSGAAVVVLSNQ